jgi:hypothetical protein
MHLPGVSREKYKENTMHRFYISDTLLLTVFFLSFSLNINAQEKQHSAHGHNEAIEHMHHQLEEDQALHKANEAQALKELNEMTIREDVNMDDIYTKIDELMAAKNQIMRLRYEHLVEMRRLLTDEQKVEYDKSVLGRSEVR